MLGLTRGTSVGVEYRKQSCWRRPRIIHATRILFTGALREHFGACHHRNRLNLSYWLGSYSYCEAWLIETTGSIFLTVSVPEPGERKNKLGRGLLHRKCFFSRFLAPVEEEIAWYRIVIISCIWSSRLLTTPAGLPFVSTARANTSPAVRD
jgi:hypothetical protein